ncbi:MAG: AraC family transcriptional regulator [Spirochaetaceae bacterium]
MNVEDLNFFNALTDLNIQYTYNNQQTTIYNNNGPISTDVIKQINIDSLLTNLDISQKVSSIIDSSGLRFLVGNSNSGKIIFGPFILENDHHPTLGRGFSLRVELPIKTAEKIEAYFKLLSLRLSGKIDNIDMESLETIKTHNPAFEQVISFDNKMIEKRYHEDRAVRDLISNGDIEGMSNVMRITKTGWDFKYRMPNNPLRLLKNMSIIVNTLGRYSAEKGGLPPFMLHSISEKYALKIEKISTVKTIEDLQKEILVSYCDAVHNYGLKNHSRNIVKSCNYILTNLQNKISLEDIAKEVNVNPSYLSRVFKKEMGYTISKYIREKRVIEAKWMLTNTDDSITDIALNLGFEDVNYFTKVFKKERGITPSEYKKTFRL